MPDSIHGFHSQDSRGLIRILQAVGGLKKRAKRCCSHLEPIQNHDSKGINHNPNLQEGRQFQIQVARLLQQAFRLISPNQIFALPAQPLNSALLGRFPHLHFHPNFSFLSAAFQLGFPIQVSSIPSLVYHSLLPCSAQVDLLLRVMLQ